MPVLNDLFKGFDATKHNTVDEIVKLVNSATSELKVKLLIDDGDKEVYVPKARLDEEIGKKKTIQKTLDDTMVELGTIKKEAGDNTALATKLTTLENANKELDLKLKAQALDTAIKLKAIELGAKDKTGNDVLAVIDKSKLKLNDDGTVTGLDETFKDLQEKKDYFFEVAAGGTGNPGQKGKGGSETIGIDGIGKKLAEENAGAMGNQGGKTVDDLYFS